MAGVSPPAHRHTDARNSIHQSGPKGRGRSSNSQRANGTLVVDEATSLGLVDPAWRPALGETETVEHAGEATVVLMLHDSPPFR